METRGNDKDQDRPAQRTVALKTKKKRIGQSSSRPQKTNVTEASDDDMSDGAPDAGPRVAGGKKDCSPSTDALADQLAGITIDAAREEPRLLP